MRGTLGLTILSLLTLAACSEKKSAEPVAAAAPAGDPPAPAPAAAAAPSAPAAADPATAAGAAAPGGLPAFDAVKSTLCPLFDVPAKHCTEAAFEKVGTLDVDGDKKLEWVYITKVGPEDCFEVHRCFAIVQASAAGYRSVLDGIGNGISIASGEARGGYRPLHVSSARNTQEYDASVFVWSGEKYVRGEHEVCSFEQRGRTWGGEKSTLCSAPRGEEILL